NPPLLYALPERLITAGGTYWVELANADTEMSGLAAATLPEVSVSGQAPSTPAVDRKRRRNESTSPQAEPEPRPARPPRVGLIRFWARFATIAASTLIFLYVVETREKLLSYFDPDGEYHTPTVVPSPAPVVLGEPPWGWNRLSLYDQTGTPAEYYKRLADAAGEWYDEVPFSSAALARRLGALRSGLSQMLLATHETLPENERDWLIEQAKGWSEIVDAGIRGVEDGKSVDEIRANLDEAVGLIVRTLHDRADAQP
ncbi:MAG: hypothetical protein AB7I30_03430, partial [Isosphaeraceae bacterium]